MPLLEQLLYCCLHSVQRVVLCEIECIDHEVLVIVAFVGLEKEKKARLQLRRVHAVYTEHLDSLLEVDLLSGYFAEVFHYERLLGLYLFLEVGLIEAHIERRAKLEESLHLVRHFQLEGNHVRSEPGQPYSVEQHDGHLEETLVLVIYGHVSLVELQHRGQVASQVDTVLLTNG